MIAAAGCGEDEGGRTTAGYTSAGLTGAAVGGTEGDDDDDNGGTKGDTPDDDDDDDDDAVDDGEDGPKFDLGVQPDSNMEIEEGCTKVDFLFVIDNSGSMEDEQDNLIANFPTFITGIQSTLEQVDEFQVGVVTTDVYEPNNIVPGCNVLGGLVTKTGGDFSSNMVCGPYAGGHNYMTELDDLSMTFQCAARVGTSGDGTERPMDSLIAVVNKVHGGAGMCNEGFLRDDALLVVVIITDEWDGPNDPETPGSAGTPQEWYDAVVAAKLDIPENVVVLSLINYAGGPCPPSDPEYDGQHIAQFTNLFGDNGFLGGVCELDYGPIFTEAVGIIDNACNNFMPPG